MANNPDIPNIPGIPGIPDIHNGSTPPPVPGNPPVVPDTSGNGLPGVPDNPEGIPALPNLSSSEDELSRQLKLIDEKERKVKEEKRKQQEILARRAAEEKRKQEEEQARIAAEKRKRQEAEAKKRAEAEARAKAEEEEKKRRAEEAARKKAEEERLKKEEAEKKRLAEEARKKAAAEAKAKEKEAENQKYTKAQEAKWLSIISVIYLFFSFNAIIGDHPFWVLFWGIICIVSYFLVYLWVSLGPYSNDVPELLVHYRNTYWNLIQILPASVTCIFFIARAIGYDAPFWMWFWIVIFSIILLIKLLKFKEIKSSNHE